MQVSSSIGRKVPLLISRVSGAYKCNDQYAIARSSISSIYFNYGSSCSYSTRRDECKERTVSLDDAAVTGKSPSYKLPTTAVADGASGSDVDSKDEHSNDEKRKNKSVFPWRHSAHPLDRMNPDKPEFLTKGPSGEGWPSYVSFFQMLYVGRELGIPFWKTAFTVGWQQEFAGNFANAFQATVASIRDQVIDVQKSGCRVNDEGENSNLLQNCSNSEHNSSAEANERSNEGSDLLRLMLEENLYELFEGARRFGKESFEIQLKTQPTAWYLISANVIPFVTRQDVKIKPSLKSALKDLQDQFKNVPKSRQNMNELVLEAKKWFQKETGHNEWRTICVQVEIQCNEIFYVRDRETGEIVQGNENGTEKKVTHVVKFEMVTTEGQLERIPLISLLGPPENRLLGRYVIEDLDEIRMLSHVVFSLVGK